MSRYSFPTEITANEMMKSLNMISDWTNTDDFVGALPMVNPIGAAAAATAIGFGVAGQMTGMMMGAAQGAMLGSSTVMGAQPDLSWLIPTLAEDLVPTETEDQPVAKKPAKAKSPSATKSADIVELNRFGKAADAAAAKPVRPKPDEAKAVRAKTARVKPVAAKTAEPEAAQVKPVAAKSTGSKKIQTKTAETKPDQTIPAKTLQPEDFRRPADMEKPEYPDDLKLVSGIGPKLEQVLNGLGVWTFKQISDWSAQEIAWVDDYLQFRGRIGRDDWVSQARGLDNNGSDAG